MAAFQLSWGVAITLLRKQVLEDDNDVTYLLFYDANRSVLAPSVRALYRSGCLMSYGVPKESRKLQRVCFIISKLKAVLPSA